MLIKQSLKGTITIDYSLLQLVEDSTIYPNISLEKERVVFYDKHSVDDDESSPISWEVVLETIFHDYPEYIADELCIVSATMKEYDTKTGTIVVNVELG